MPFEQSFLLPSGEDLRVFLTQEFITPALLRQILRQRGVFIQSQDKKDLLPFLLLSRLTPDEFETLIEAAKTREESPKLRSNSHTLTCDGKTLEDMLPAEIDLKAIAGDEFENSKIEGTPTLVSDPQGGRESYVMRYKITRISLHTDWIKGKRQFEGEVRYTLFPDQKEIKVTATHTAPETEKINRKFTHSIEREWKQKEYINKDEDLRVLFNSFDNQQRITFFMKFTALNEPLGITFTKLSRLAVRPDANSTGLTEEKLLWMKNKVKKMELSGESLHDIFIFTEPTCQPYVIMWDVELKFSFVTPDHSGYFVANLEFADYGSSASPFSEFQISIPTLMVPGKLQTHPDCKELRRRFFLKLTDEKHKAFSSVLKTTC